MASSWPPTPVQGPKVDEAAIARFEALLGTRLPDDYRAYLLEVNGGRPTKAHRNFKLGRGRSTLNNLLSLDHEDDSFNLAERNEFIQDDLPGDLLMVGSDDGGSRICVCIRGEHKGEVWFFDTADRRPSGSNPRVLWHDRRDMTKLADSFRAFMAALEPL